MAKEESALQTLTNLKKGISDVYAEIQVIEQAAENLGRLTRENAQIRERLNALLQTYYDTLVQMRTPRTKAIAERRLSVLRADLASLSNR